MFSAPIAVFSSIWTVLTSVVPSLNVTVYFVGSASPATLKLAFTASLRNKLSPESNVPYVSSPGTTSIVTSLPFAPGNTVNINVPSEELSASAENSFPAPPSINSPFSASFIFKSNNFQSRLFLPLGAS